MIELNKNRTRLIIEKFSDCLDWCYKHGLTKEQVIRFFGKKRAERWCGSWNGYPDVTMITWWEKRYNTDWTFRQQYDEYYKWYRFINADKHTTYKDIR